MTTIHNKIIKKTFSLFCLGIIVLSFVFIFSSCSSRTSQYDLQKEYFLTDESETPDFYDTPYFNFKKDDCTWHTGQGSIYSHSLNGKYKVKGDTIICTESYWDLSVKLKLIGNDKIQIVSIKDNDNVLDWLNEGDILTYAEEIKFY